MAEPSEADIAKARELCAHDHCKTYNYCRTCDTSDGEGCRACDRIAAALAQSREDGRATYRAEIVAALDCHPAIALQEIARLRDVADEAIVIDEVRQREQRAREEGERVGAERERRACWELAERERATYENRQPSAPTQSGRATHASIFAGLAAGAAFIRDAIAARGPMGQDA